MIMEKLIYKFTKGKKNDLTLIVADYEPQVLSEDEYNKVTVFFKNSLSV
jgi:HAE1 family hydrophobic/amphiphilic exporter-1